MVSQDVEELIGYAEKEGFISDGETWTDDEKIAYYEKCQLAENEDYE